MESQQLPQNSPISQYPREEILMYCAVFLISYDLCNNRNSNNHLNGLHRWKSSLFEFSIIQFSKRMEKCSL